jgi:hypothetical protein
MSDGSVNNQAPPDPLPLVDYTCLLKQDFSGRDACDVLTNFGAIVNRIVGVSLASGKFTSANPVIQHAMQAAASLEIAAGNLNAQIEQQSNILKPTFGVPQAGQRRM